MDVNLIVDSPFAALPRGDRQAPAVSLDGTESWTYAELRERRDRFVHVLLDAGVQQGDRVGMVMVNSLEYVALYFAIARLGAIAVRLNFRLTASELSFLVTDSGCDVLFFDHTRVGQLEAVREEVELRRWFCLPDQDGSAPDWAEVPDLDRPATPDPALPRPSGDDPVMIMYTSGTTGRPKGSVWTHDNVMWFACIQVMQWGFSRETVTLTTGPLYHAGAFECFTIPALFVNGHAVIMSSGGMSAGRIIDVVDRAGVTEALLYPFLIYDILEADEAQLSRLATLRLIMSGGDPLQPWAVAALSKNLPDVVLNKGYGLTEGGAQSAVLEYEHVGRHPDSVGRPLPLTEIRVVDGDRQDMAAGEVGEVWVRSPAVSGRYWNRPEATAETFVDGWCRTGDLGRVTEDGFLVLSGRGKDMIRSGGENVYPAEVEMVLGAHPGVARITVVAVPDQKYLETGCAVVVPADVSASTDDLETSLRALAREQLATFKCPRYYSFVAELPVSPSGKILKRKLREQYAFLGQQNTTN